MSLKDFNVNQEKLELARKFLDITLPVCVIKRHMIYAGGRYLGCHTGTHRLSVASFLDPIEGSMVIYHELAHAKQKERLEDAFGLLYSKQLEAIGLNDEAIAYGRPITREYAKIPFEREADWTERRMFKKLGILWKEK